jgi:hypothetical protein
VDQYIYSAIRLHDAVLSPGTSRKVVGSIPENISEFFNSPNPSKRTMTLESTQPLTEMRIRNLPGGEAEVGA